MELVKFSSWPEVMTYARGGAPLYYQAPMDHRATRFLPGSDHTLGYEVKGRTIRLWPPGSVGRGKARTADPFNADVKHLDRFSRPAEGKVESSGMRERVMRGKHQPSLPGFPDIPEKLEIKIPVMSGWEQIGGDMDPGAHGGLIATADGDHIELLEIQPVREHVGDREAADVGHPFWTKEAWFDLADLDPSNKDVQSALESSGFDSGDQKTWFEDEATPEQRALVIAEALLMYGRGDEGPAGWSDDLPDYDVKWSGGKAAPLRDYLADEDEAFAQDVLLEDFDVDYEKYAPNEKEPTSGLKVTASNGNVEIVEWTDIVDATGEDQPEGEEILRQSADVALSELFNTKSKHRGTYSGDNKTVSIVELAKMDSDEEREEAVVAAAIAYLGYHGGTEEFVDQIGD